MNNLDRELLLVIIAAGAAALGAFVAALSNILALPAQKAGEPPIDGVTKKERTLDEPQDFRPVYAGSRVGYIGTLVGAALLILSLMFVLLLIIK
jgi:hypothetical protein